MAFVNKYNVAPPEWLPIQDRDLIDRVAMESFYDHQGKQYECPDFEVKVVHDVHNYMAIDLFYRIRQSDKKNQKLVLLLPSPENQVYITVVEMLNKFMVSCRNVHVFFLNEYANEKGQVAPWQSPVSKAGHFVRYFYQRLDAALRMPMEQIHFFTTENWKEYSDLLAAEGGADVVYTSHTWGGGLGAIDAQTYPAQTMEEFLAMGSNYVTPMPETIAQDSLRGMFGCAGDIGNVPPCAVTVGPKDIASAKERVDVEFLTSCEGGFVPQAFSTKMSLLGPVSPKNPGSMIRLFPGVCYVSEVVAKEAVYTQDEDEFALEIEAIRAREQN